MVSGRSGSVVEESGMGVGVAFWDGVDVREGEGDGEDIFGLFSGSFGRVGWCLSGIVLILATRLGRLQF